MPRYTGGASLLLAVLAGGQPSLANAQSDPLVGTWKVDVAQSACDPPPYPFASWTSHVEKAAEGYKNTGDGLGINGKTRHLEVLWRVDGEAALTIGDTPPKSYKWKRIDEHSFEIVRTGVNEFTTMRTVISPDSRMRVNFVSIKDGHSSASRTCLEVMYKH